MSTRMPVAKRRYFVEQAPDRFYDDLGAARGRARRLSRTMPDGVYVIAEQFDRDLGDYLRVGSIAYYGGVLDACEGIFACPTPMSDDGGQGTEGLAMPTPGPWLDVGDGYVEAQSAPLRFRSGWYDHAYLQAGAEKQAEWLANARLIAAAPELLEALEEARNVLANSGAESGYCMCGDPIDSHSIGSGHAPVDAHIYMANQTIEKIEAAIAKARGQ